MLPSKKKQKLSPLKFVDVLEQEIKTFGESSRPLLTYQHNRLKSCQRLLSEDPMLSGLSETQRFGKSRARRILFDILNRQGEWAFFLCAVAASVSMIQKIPDNVVLEIHQWFENAAVCPRGLVDKAKELCNDILDLKNSPGLFPTQD